MPCLAARPLRGTTEAGVPRRDLDRQADGYERPLARRELAVDDAAQVEAGIVVVRCGGKARVGMQAAERQLHQPPSVRNRA